MSLSAINFARATTREATYGTPPSTELYLEVRVTSQEGDHATESDESQVRRADLTVEDAFRTNVTANLSIEDEVSIDLHDKEIEDALKSTFSTALAIDGAAADIAATASGNTIDAGASKFTTVALWQVVRFFGFPTNDGGVGYFDAEVIAKAGDGSQLTLSGITLVNETPAGTDAKLRGKYVRNGVVRHWVTFEEDFGATDYVANRFVSYEGMQCTQWVYSFDHPGKQTFKFTYEGQTTLNASATISSGAYTAYATQPIMNTAEHFQAAFEGGSALTAKVKSLNLTVDSPRNVVDGAGSLGADDSAMNTFSMKLSISLFGSEAAAVIEQKHKAFSTPSDWEWKTQDANTAAYHYMLPRIFHDEGARKAGARDSRVMIALGAKVVRDATKGFMIQVCSLPASA